MKVAVIMGSNSDYTTMEETCKLLEEFEIPFDKKVVSAHRTPDLLVEFSKNFHNLFSEIFQKIAERTGCFPNVSQELLV